MTRVDNGLASLVSSPKLPRHLIFFIWFWFCYATVQLPIGGRPVEFPLPTKPRQRSACPNSREVSGNVLGRAAGATWGSSVVTDLRLATGGWKSASFQCVLDFREVDSSRWAIMTGWWPSPQVPVISRVTWWRAISINVIKCGVNLALNIRFVTLIKTHLGQSPIAAMQQVKNPSI